MKIRAKIQVRFFGIAILLAVCLMSVVYFSMVSNFEQEEGDQLKVNVIQSAKAIDDFMFTRVKDLNVLSNNPLFSTSSNNTISNYLSRVVDQYPYYDNIIFVNTNATILASSSKEFIGLNILDIEPDIEEEFYKTLKGGDDDVYISDIAQVSEKEINEKSPLDIELLSNVIDLDGNVIGVLVGTVNVQFIKDIIYDIDNRTIGNEYAYLVNSTGDVVISGNPETVILQPHPDLSLKDLQQKLKNEEDGYIIYKNSKGKKVISGFSDLAEYGTDKVGNWSLISTAPYDDIMVPIYQILYKELITFSIILLLIFLLTINLSRSLAEPIIQLQNAVSEFNIDSSPLELKIGKNDEVESLSESFNMMFQKIHQSSKDRRHIAKLLNENKNHLNNIINNIGDPVFVKDDQSRLLIVNDAFCKIFNLSKPDVLGLTLAEHVTEEERESFLKIDRQVLENGIENINEESLTIKGHETRIISTKKTRYVDKNGNKFLIGVIRDITSQKEAEIALKLSEEKFSNAFHSGPAGLTITRIKDGKFLEVNDAFLNMFEFNREEVIGKTSIEIKMLKPEVREKLISKQIEANGLNNHEHVAYSKSGKVVNLLFSSKPITIDSEDCHVTTMIDITDRKVVENLLKESEKKYRTLFENMNIGFVLFEVIVDKKDNPIDLIIVAANEEFEKTTSLQLENVIGKRLTHVLPGIENDEADWIGTYGKIALEGGAQNFEEPSEILGNYYSVNAFQSGFKQCAVTFLDITNRKNAEIELEKYRNQLEELVELRTNQLEKEKIKAQSADLMKSAFLATMSHELRTPMNSIIGFTGILLRELAGPLNAEQKKQLLMVKNSGQHLLGLINDVLDISKIEAGRLNVSRQPFSYLESLEKTIEFINPQANEKGLQITTQFSKTDIILNSDERRIEQVILNLLSNAIKFSEQGTIIVKVDVKNNFLITQVIDQGIGISKRDQNKLFMPFIQVNGGLTRRHEGTGLGLAICKRLIEKLGGKIQVTSEIGKGSNFTFKVPLEHIDNK